MMASNTYVFNGLLREYYRIRKKEVSVVRWYRSYFKACTYFFFQCKCLQLYTARCQKYKKEVDRHSKQDQKKRSREEKRAEKDWGRSTSTKLEAMGR